jgi:ParB/RepB/Spo0J family partition protein
MSWSEEAMDELTQSVKEQGVVVPIKVRPISAERFDAVTQKLISAKWEIVYGHRRVEASRRAGLRYINVIIEEMNDTDALIQAVLENVQREGLSHFDQGRAYLDLKKLGLTYKEIALKVGKCEDWVGRCIQLVKDKKLQKLEDPSVSDAADKGKAIRSATKEDANTREVFTAKVVNEGLTTKQTQDVAAKLKDTQDPEVRKRILATPVADASIVADAVELMLEDERIEARILEVYGTEEEQVAQVERHAQQDAKDDEQQWWNANAGEVAKDIARTIKRTRAEYQALWLGVERGAIGPEHMPYLEKRLRNLGEYFIELADELDEQRKGAVGG